VRLQCRLTDDLDMSRTSDRYNTVRICMIQERLGIGVPMYAGGMK
jgi:hypothetical protein